MKKLRFIFAALIISVLFCSCINDQEIKLNYNGYKPSALDDGWLLSSASKENMDSLLLEDAYRLVYNEEKLIMARSLIVIRNGHLIAEAYPHSEVDRDQIQNLQSCTKSFTSVLAGVAIKQGLIKSQSEKFSDIYPEHFVNYSEKKDITLFDALTMQTGIDFKNDTHTLDLYTTAGSSVEYVLSRPKSYSPGIVFYYHDGAPHLVSAAIQSRFGKPLSDFAAEFLFKPLGITDWKWEAAKDGVTFGAFSLYLKPRDAAKFGQMLLNNGKWNGEQIVDSSWIKKATQPYVTATPEGASYGFYFWLFPAYQAFAAQGHGGQYIFVAPSKNLVIVYTAWPYTSGELFGRFNEIADLIIKSCR